jgi:hypothetical protein
MDFEKIKIALPTTLRNRGLLGSEQWANQLIAEVERLRRIEDELVATEQLPPGREKVLAYMTLTETLARNPRPDAPS